MISCCSVVVVVVALEIEWVCYELMKSSNLVKHLVLLASDS